jgi:ATP/maltotriose-dependent transcriptional regulator MalT
VMLQSAIQTYLKDKHVSDVELETLDLALSGKPAETIAKQLAISEIAVRKRMGSIYSKLAITGSTHGKLARLRAHLEANQLDQPIVAVSDTSSIFKSGEFDWRLTQLPASMAGRQAELHTLQGWVGPESAQLVVLWGLGGVGKTTLAQQLAQSMQPQFAQGAWRSLEDAPSLAQLLDALLPSSPSATGDGLDQLTIALSADFG